jgi:hypothetical protein
MDFALYVLIVLILLSIDNFDDGLHRSTGDRKRERNIA